MIFVVARSEEAGKVFLDRHSSFKELITVLTGQSSYFDVINQVVSSSPYEQAIIVHDDVYLRPSFGSDLADLVDRLAREWPNWGLVGNAGIVPHVVGYSGERVVRYVSDPHGGPNHASTTTPAETVDGNLLLLNVKALRNLNVQVPSFLGFQLYDIVLSIEVLFAGLAVLVAPELACFHASPGSQDDFDQGAKSDAIRMHLASRLMNTQVTTLNGLVELDDVTTQYFSNKRFEIGLQSLRNAQRGRERKSVEIVTRTQFTRLGLLRRNVETVEMFKAGASAVDVSHTLVSSADPVKFREQLPDVRYLRFESETPGDDRFQLVKWAARNSTSDYLLFLDDDDWVFPNAAEFISLVVATAPIGSTFFFDTRHFKEEFADSGNDALPLRALPDRKFSAREFLGCLTGHNSIPFCGVVFPRIAIETLPDELVDSVVLFEDLATTLHVMTDKDFLPVVGEVMIAGISVRGEGQTIFSQDRTSWNASMAVLASWVASGRIGSPILSLPTLALKFPGESLSSMEQQLNEAREAHHNAINVITSMRSTWSWGLTKPFRLICRKIAFGRKKEVKAERSGLEDESDKRTRPKS